MLSYKLEQLMFDPLITNVLERSDLFAVKFDMKGKLVVTGWIEDGNCEIKKKLQSPVLGILIILEEYFKKGKLLLN